MVPWQVPRLRVPKRPPLSWHRAMALEETGSGISGVVAAAAAWALLAPLLARPQVELALPWMVQRTATAAVAVEKVPAVSAAAAVIVAVAVAATAVVAATVAVATVVVEIVVAAAAVVLAVAPAVALAVALAVATVAAAVAIAATVLTSAAAAAAFAAAVAAADPWGPKAVQAVQAELRQTAVASETAWTAAADFANEVPLGHQGPVPVPSELP